MEQFVQEVGLEIFLGYIFRIENYKRNASDRTSFKIVIIDYLLLKLNVEIVTSGHAEKYKARNGKNIKYIVKISNSNMAKILSTNFFKNMGSHWLIVLRRARKERHPHFF